MTPENLPDLVDDAPHGAYGYAGSADELRMSYRRCRFVTDALVLAESAPRSLTIMSRHCASKS